jgi:hypothetical protein
VWAPFKDISMRWRLRAILAFLLALAAPSIATAHGRFPRAQRLVEDPGNPDHLAVGTTFGVLVSDDRGKTWSYVCGAAFGDPELEMELGVGFSTDGDLLVSSIAGLWRSTGAACEFQPVIMGDESHGVWDFTVDSEGKVLAVVTSIDNGQQSNHLQESSNGGSEFHVLGAALPDDLQLATSIGVAPNDPNRIYIAGIAKGGAGVLVRSDDRGQTFSITPLQTDAGIRERPYIAAIDPRDENSVYVRTDAWTSDPDASGVLIAADSLLYSRDAGASFSQLIRAGGKLFAFAFSPDGSDMLIGYGDPMAGGGRTIDPNSLGIFRAPAGTSDFERVFSGAISCLAWTRAAVFACTSEPEVGYTLGLSQAVDWDIGNPAPFAPLLNLMELQGPRSCTSAASHVDCSSAWAHLCEEWGRTDCLPPSSSTVTAQHTSGCSFHSSPNAEGLFGGTKYLLLLTALVRRRFFRRQRVRRSPRDKEGWEGNGA